MTTIPQPGPSDDAAASRQDARAHPHEQVRQIEKAFAVRQKRKGSGGVLMTGLCAIAIVWLTSFAYWRFMPQVYVSRWSLIVPVSNSSSSVTLDTIGQASTAPMQPFGMTHLSPKVIYREIATSEQVVERAATAMGIKPSRFGKPRIRLIDETPLLNFQIGGSSAEEARAKGRAIIEALNLQLDNLRRDEFERRAALVRENLKLYQASVDKARERIVEFQRQSGLLSIQQFTEAASSAEMLRRKISDKRSEVDRSHGEIMRTQVRVGVDPATAAKLLRLAADPSFTQLSLTYSEATSSVQEMSHRLGPRHPALVAAVLKQQGTLQEIERKAVLSGMPSDLDIGRVVMLLNDSHFSDLMQKMVAADAYLTGLRQELDTFEAEARKLEAIVARMGEDAARLEALKKDHLVAEAVYSSAAARLDTNRSDLFSSYPLLQVLSEPDLPMQRSQPRLVYAIAAAVLGTLIVFLAWGAAWAHSRFVRRRRKSG